MRASTTTVLHGDDAVKMTRLLELLEDLDDTQNVYCNADIADEALAE
jgi:transcriptional/translational regulatory protein YebC/TACO1